MRNLLGAVRGVVVVQSSYKGGFVSDYERGNGLLFAPQIGCYVKM